MDDEGEAIDARLARLQIANGGRPVEIGHQVQIGVLAERSVGIGTQGDHDRLEGCRRPAAQFATAVERGHHGDQDVDAALTQVGQVLVAGPFDDDRLALEVGRGVAANDADVTGQDVSLGESAGVARVGRAAGQWLQAVESGVLELVERGAGGLFERAPAADQRHGGQIEVDHRIGVAQVGGASFEGLSQAVVIQTGNHEHMLLGEDARLGAIGQDDAPALQPGANTGAVDDGRALGHQRQGRAEFVPPSRAAQLQRGRHAFQGDGVYLAVIGLNQGASAFGIAAAAHAPQQQVLAHERVVGRLATLTVMDN